MSALVGYESSDDEQDVNTVENAVTTTSIADASKPTQAGNNFRDGIPPPVLEPKPSPMATMADMDNGPMVGPIMPEQTANESEQDSLMEMRESMSDRDIIHHLTAAPQPMTSLPSSPPGSPNPAMDAKFKRFLELKAKGVHFNLDLASKPPFRNPGLLSSLMARAGLEEEDQYRTSLPRETFDPLGLPASGYKEALLESQYELRVKDQAMKKTLSAAGKRTIDFRSGGSSDNASADSTPGTSSKRKRP
ncbi:20S proteasome subunit beta 7 [Exophiala viscosa]|uniref:20S proteasome subunit beta 7 n=1 Tax=Exophiala viscosa TaxID=2486360 RepID=A0AAN6IDU7_9EURO|nr:20S proteasome subunit beta 7 [Exophiala viscosa]KAI1621629.1 20S proteasome subunit beta 7 [Exophiala viscosa]